MSNDHPRGALLVAARNPTAPRTGRIAVLETAVRSLQSAGRTVTVAALTDEAGPDEWCGARVVRIPTMSLPRTVVAAGRALATRRCLNEAVFDSREIRERVAAVARECGAGFVVADTMRTVAAAEATGLPVVAHLDDLLSLRYASKEFAEGNASVLGYMAGRFPPSLLPPLEWATRRALGLEARRAVAREVHISRTVAVTALTGADEARHLADRSDRPVETLPMAVAPREPVDPRSAEAARAVFLGVLHYGPNVAALRHLRDEVLPLLRADGLDLHVDVIGHAPEGTTEEFAGEGFTFLGYVDDLRAALAGHRMFLSPVLSGTGVKTKVLDGMSVGLPVVATSLGVAGVPVTDGVEALVGDTPRAFADHVRALHDDPDLAERIGTAGRELLATRMHPDLVADAWAAVARRALAPKDAR